VARFGDESAIVVDRYDRRMVDGELVRIHQEDTCQALGKPPDAKYQNEGGPSPKDLAALFRTVMPPRAADDAVWRFLDALIWNWLIAGTDAHAKNYSLLLSGGEVRLAPLYDIASALPYGTNERRLRLAMKIGGDYRVYPYRNTWERAAEDLGLNVDAVTDRVAHLALAAPDAFADAASQPDVVELYRPLPKRLVELVDDRAKRCLAILPKAATTRAMQTTRYQQELAKLSDAVPPQAVSADGAPALVRDAAQALRDAIAAEPRDMSVVREGIFELGVAALRAIHAVGDTESPPGYVNPTKDRLPGLIKDFAPNIANLPIPQDNPVKRVADEMLRAANRFVDADPKSVFGSADERLRALYAVVGIAARALAL
jgi:HipA-like C-terminal domain